MEARRQFQFRFRRRLGLGGALGARRCRIGRSQLIGAELEMWNGKGKVIGLTNDFNNDNLHYGIEPLIFLYSENYSATTLKSIPTMSLFPIL